jgi:acyl-CoA dehydrogenase
MSFALAISLLTAGSLALAYLRAPLFIWTAFVIAMLVIQTLTESTDWGVWLAWAAFAPVAVILHIRPLRLRLISRPMLAYFRCVLPGMSETEREALEAGSVAWDGELFSGRPDWQRLLKMPAPRLSEREQAFIDGPVEALCRMLDDWQITQARNDLPPEVWTFLKREGFFGMIIPRRYGGLEFSALAHSAVVMKISSRSISAAVTTMVPNSLGPAELLLNYGTDAQKDHYLPRLAKGDEVPCFALTSPVAGSDAASMTDNGVVCRGEFDGKADVLGIRLNWNKRYITLGPVATVLGLAFKLYDPDHLLGDKPDIGITLALIPTRTPGVEIGRRHNPLSIAFQNGPNRGHDVFIPLDWVIGGPERVGQGWRMLMECLAAGRSISLPALSCGAGKLASRSTGAYARIRRQFNLPIGRFEGVAEALARIAGRTYQMDAARVLTAGIVDQGEKPSVISAIVKYHLTERMRRVIDDAMDVQGGAGICLGPRNLLGRAYQAVPISITVEGANILTRSLIIFGQGAIRCHPYVLKEMQAVADADTPRGERVFDKALFGHIGFTISNGVRSVLLGLTGARLALSPVQGPVAQYYRAVTRMSAAFALLADLSMLILGGGLKRMERLSARLGDVLSHLYLISAVLKQHHDHGSPEEDLPLVHWACQDGLHTIQRRIDGLLRNFPNRPIAWMLRWMVFPLGRPYRKQSDTLGSAVANLLLAPSPVRDRLTQGIFVTRDTAEPLGLLEDALVKAVRAERLEGPVRDAIRSGEITARDPAQQLLQAIEAGIITSDEAGVIRAAALAREAVVQVDDFAADAQSTGNWSTGLKIEEQPAWQSTTETAAVKQSM